jgi:ligand-binding sensor domain-containing protein/anti-sigma regulatory factor (Ser/Thr protein kinase)
MRIWVILTIVLSALSNPIKAQIPEYRQYTVKDGLPSATIYDVLQDKQGFIWCGTENGLCRFDGKTFKTFTRNDGLTDNTVLNLFEDSRRRLWIISLTGKLCYYKDGKIHNPENDSLLSVMPYIGLVTVPVEDKDGTVYFVREKQYIALRNKKITISGNKTWYPPATDSFVNENVCPGLNIIFVNGYYAELYPKNLDFYFYCNRGIFETGNVIKKVWGRDTLPEINDIRTQKQINNDLWLFSLNKGAYQISNLGSHKPSVHHFLDGYNINNVLIDKENNTWFSTTGKGLFLISGNTKRNLYLRKSSGLPREVITALFLDSEHNVWAGATNNNIYRIKNNIADKYVSGPTEKMNIIYDFVEDGKGEIYCIQNESFIKIRKIPGGNKIKFEPVRLQVKDFESLSNYKSLSINSNGTMVATTPISILIYQTNPLLEKDNKTRVISPKENKRILTSFISRSGNIWVANNYGLNLLSGDSLIPYYNRTPVLKEPISRITELEDGNLLITTRGKGIIVFDGRQVLQKFTEQQGLASGICNRIFVSKNHIWVATVKGISKLIYNKGVLSLDDNYSYEDGLLSNEINDLTEYNDTLYAASADGLTIMPDKGNLQQDPPDVYFNAALYGSSDISDKQDTTLQYNKSYMKFNFVGITYQQPKKVVYRYRLVGADDRWFPNTTGAVDYAGLMPGDYTFEVMAKKIDSDWSLPGKFHFTIRAPFWMKDWFRVLMFSFLFSGMGLGTYGAIRIRRKQKDKKLALQNRMVHLEQQALNALMNPHFIFNALNSIQQYLHKNDTDSAHLYLSLFAKLTRKNMEAVMKNSVTLEDEIERLELYLKFEKLRFGAKLQYHINMEDDLETDDIFIPPMVLQPFVENAIWHGIMPLPEGGSIYINAGKLNDSQYKVEIRDTGMGIEASRELKKSTGLPHTSKGMKLTIERLELWTRISHSNFELKAEQGESSEGDYAGTTITLILPL